MTRTGADASRWMWYREAGFREWNMPTLRGIWTGLAVGLACAAVLLAGRFARLTRPGV